MSRPSSRQLLARILDESSLVAEVRALPAAALAKLIDHIGLEDAGEIVQLATAEQLERVFDEDLWKSQGAGEDDAFDAKRFIVWLEILLEAGDAAVARRLAELPKDVITLAFHRLIVVVDVDELAADFSNKTYEDGEAIERALEGSLTHEIGSYMIVARRPDGWDAIVTALAALDEEDHACCTRLLDRCAAMTSREAEEDGLAQVLTAEETLEADVAADRSDRRAREGFVAPSDVKSFLRLARETKLEDAVASEARDPVTRAYFRELDRSAPASSSASSGPTEAPRLLKILEDAGVMDIAAAERNAPKTRAPALPPKQKKKSKGELSAAPEHESADDASLASFGLEGTTTTSLLGHVLGELAANDPRGHSERMEELAFLVNILLVGETFDGRAFRPGEAAEAVVATANLGLEHLVMISAGSGSPMQKANAIVAAEGVVKAFRIGLRIRFERSLAW